MWVAKETEPNKSICPPEMGGVQKKLRQGLAATVPYRNDGGGGGGGGGQSTGGCQKLKNRVSMCIKTSSRPKTKPWGTQ